MGHTAKRSDDSCGESQRLSFGGSALQRPKWNTEHDRVHTQALSESTELGGRREWCWSVQQTTHSMRRCALKKQRVSEHAETNTWVSTWTSEQLVETAKPLTQPRLRIAQSCEFGARGARQTHSQAATSGSGHSSKRKVAKRGT